jgi:hypothetical protein
MPKLKQTFIENAYGKLSSQQGRQYSGDHPTVLILSQSEFVILDDGKKIEFDLTTSQAFEAIRDMFGVEHLEREFLKIFYILQIQLALDTNFAERLVVRAEDSVKRLINGMQVTLESSLPEIPLSPTPALDVMELENTLKTLGKIKFDLDYIDLKQKTKPDPENVNTMRLMVTYHVNTKPEVRGFLDILQPIESNYIGPNPFPFGGGGLYLCDLNLDKCLRFIDALNALPDFAPEKQAEKHYRLY